MDFGPGGVRQKNAPPAHEPDLSAPGDEMVSVGPGGAGHYIGSGASLAAAGVAGTAALVRAYHPDLTAARPPAASSDTAYPSDTPRLDPYAALSLVQDRVKPSAQAAGPRTDAASRRPRSPHPLPDDRGRGPDHGAPARGPRRGDPPGPHPQLAPPERL
ncbi:hypothetical protein GCM10023238_14400 [Streptomyces heliomycini]